MSILSTLGFLLKAICTNDNSNSPNNLYLSEHARNELDNRGISNINRKSLVFNNVSYRTMDEIKSECRRKGIKL